MSVKTHILGSLRGVFRSVFSLTEALFAPPTAPLTGCSSRNEPLTGH